MPKIDPSGDRVYFISGMDDLTEEEFNDHYARQIRNSNAVYPNCLYILGDFNATDRIAQEFLRTIGVSPERVTIYYRNIMPINKHRCRTTMIESDIARERVMTTMSSHDIAWVRPGSQTSDVERNIKRRYQKFLDSKKKFE